MCSFYADYLKRDTVLCYVEAFALDLTLEPQLSQKHQDFMEILKLWKHDLVKIPFNCTIVYIFYSLFVQKT